MAFAGDWRCAVNNCDKSVGYVCPPCALGALKGYCEEHFAPNHKARNVRSHQPLSLAEYKMLAFMRAQADGKSLKIDADRNNFFGFHPLTGQPLQGPQWDFVTQAQSIISLVGSSGSGESLCIRSPKIQAQSVSHAMGLPCVESRRFLQAYVGDHWYEDGLFDNIYQEKNAITAPIPHLESFCETCG